MNRLGYDARPAVLGTVNTETAFILKTAGVPIPDLLTDASGKNVFLTDHNDYLQSAQGLKDANVIGTIDHHGDGSVVTANQLIYDARPIGATSTIVWIRSRNYGFDLDAPMATLLLGAILSDTSNLQSDSTTSADRAAYHELAQLAGIKDQEAFYQEMFKASISYEGLTDDEILNSDLRDYESGGRKFAIGCVSAYDRASAEDLAKRMKVLLPALSAAQGVDMSFAQVSVFHDGIDIAYVIPSDETAAEVLEAAFPDRFNFDGVSYVFEPGMSRRQVLVPAISDVLAAHPGE